ncbi:MAG: hypothetical protein H0U95_03165 [Bacteroidetes bacterium]|nr:hypothetical protein [Bacteroidota bacterium]
MDNKLITTIILTIIGSGIIAPFSKSIFHKIFAAYNPDQKKINSGIKKSFVFALRYILPIANLIYVYTTHATVDKYLVLATVFIFSILVINICVDFYGRIINDLYSKKDGAITLLTTLLKKNRGTATETADVIKSFIKIQNKHNELTEKLTDQLKNSLDINNDEKQQPT